MKIRSLTKEDIDFMGLNEDIRHKLYAYIDSECAQAIEIDGEMIAAMGITPFWPGVAEAWVRVFNPSCFVTIIRTAQNLLKDLCEKYKLHRLQATIRADDEKTLKLDTFLGFTEDTRIPEYYSDKCDAIILRYKHGS